VFLNQEVPQGKIRAATSVPEGFPIFNPERPGTGVATLMDKSPQCFFAELSEDTRF
jgi:hypothetical protein